MCCSRWMCFVLVLSVIFGLQTLGNPVLNAQETLSQKGSTSSTDKSTVAEWTQWRGPNRDGKLEGITWPDSLDESTLSKKWSVPFGPSYSGPIVVGDRVFTTETKDKKNEVVIALDRETGQEVWRQEWEGSMSVPFFAKANGDWIRATPVYDDGRLYVAGMKDLLVCLNAENGKVIWKVDFPEQLQSAVPSFGMVCSPLIDGDFLYVQAGGGFCKLNKSDGSIVWIGLKDGGGMNGSAFSSPMIETVAGKRQAIVQTREALTGVDLETGDKLWSQTIKTFRGMNILTPTKFEDNFFVSAYGGTTQLINVSKSGAAFDAKPAWNLKGEGYMSTPVVIDGHAYIHLRNQRFACFDLKNGVEKWRSKAFGKYASLVAASDKILALDERGILMLIKASPNGFELIGERQVGTNSWAHLAVRGNQVFVRNLDGLTMFEFKN